MNICIHKCLSIYLQERKKDLLDHRDDSTFSFDPSKLNVKKLNKNQKKKIDSRKGVLLASYSRKKTRRRKGKTNEGKSNNQVSKLVLLTLNIKFNLWCLYLPDKGGKVCDTESKP